MSRTSLRRTMLGCAVLLPSLVSAQGAATHSSNVWSVTFARNDSSVATTARGELRIWSLPSGRLTCRLDGSYFRAHVRTDGAHGYHVTFATADDKATGGITVDGSTCVQRPAARAETRYEDRGRQSVGTRLTIESAEDRKVRLRTPTGTTLDAWRVPSTLDVGDTWYACTETDKHKLVYYRLRGAERPEKIGESDPHSFKGCGPLILSIDSTMLLNTGAGSAVDLRRKRVLVSHGSSLPRSVGIDPTRTRLVVGHNTGVDVVDVESGNQISSRGGLNRYGDVSVSATWEAITFGGNDRPLVELRSARQGGVVLDDARSRPAADTLVARREADVRARNDSVRRVRDAEAAENARIRASNEAVFQERRQLVERQYGRISVSARLRQVQYQGAYEFIPISVNAGDLLVLVSDRDGMIGYSISDGTQMLRGQRTAENATNGFAITRSTITGNVSGNLLVQGRGAPVYVFLIRKADVK